MQLAVGLRVMDLVRRQKEFKEGNTDVLHSQIASRIMIKDLPDPPFRSRVPSIPLSSLYPFHPEPLFVVRYANDLA
jgi:hypothetical protein